MNSKTELIHKGYEYYKNKQFKQAIEIAKTLLVKRYNIDALILSGISYFKLQDYDQSEFFLKKVIKERPNDEVIAIHLIESCIKNKNFQTGLQVIEDIVTKSKTIILLEIQLLQYLGEYNKAVQKAILLQDCLIKYETLAWNYELLNKLKAAKKYALKGIELQVNNFKCNSVLSKLYIRKSKIKKACKYINNIYEQSEPFTNRSIYYSIKAQIYVKKDKFEKAFKYFTKSNNILKHTDAFKNLTGTSYFSVAKIKSLREYFAEQIKFNPMIMSSRDITFMVGFPRSGTTLLENILNAHSEISSIEEKPTIDEILQPFLEKPSDIKKLEKLNSSEIKLLQQSYINKRKLYCKSSNRIVIDKMPLNLIHMGILYRIFPNAKFIISHRDIRDVALSCYFQSFELNDAMVNFLDWNKTQAYLKELMSLGMDILNKYPIEHIFVEYEKLVDTPYDEVKEIIKFLGLDWQDSIMSYRDKIKGKEITTPSYAKISEKINTKQKQKWKKYKFAFK